MKKYILITILLIATTGTGVYGQNQTINGNLSVGGKLYLYYSDKNTTTNLYQTYIEYEMHDFNIGTRKGSNSHNVIRLKPGGYESAELGTTLELHRSVNLSGSVRTTLFSSHNGANNFINNGGNLGIGLSNPQSKLDVNGDIRAKSLNIAGTINARSVNITINAGADFVFSPDYTLKPLSELETFVKEKKHLPEIPSEKEMVENGLNVNEMQIKLLQKIEELTLYVIEQEKQNKQLESRIRFLEEENKKFQK